jgi:dTMP kinase
MSKGIFITFEGADGCGKSTQAKFLKERLDQEGYDVVLTREPGGCPISEKIRDIILDNENEDILDITEAYLYAASRAQHVHEVIKPAIAQGKIVICDRFIHSSIAYQGYGRMLGKQRVLDINKHAIGDCMPDYTLFMKIDPNRGFDRMKKRKNWDRLEVQKSEFYERMFEGYMKILDEKEDNMVVVDASGSKFDTKGIIFEQIEIILKSSGLK